MNDNCNFVTGANDMFRGVVKLSKHLEAVDTALEIINDYAPTFFEEYASRSVHDAKEGGLAVHTSKVFTTMYDLVFNGAYSYILSAVNEDALIIGAIIHDIGKTMEYANGRNGEFYYVSHNILGVELLVNARELLVGRYGEDTYYRIMSIIGQHHGEFGERPQTIEAYVIHLADMLEARLQILNEEANKTFVGSLDSETKPDTITSKYIPFKLDVGNLFGRKGKCNQKG